MESRCRAKQSDLEKEIDERPNGHNQLMYRRVHLSTIADREFLQRVVWKASAGGFLVVSVSEESEKRPTDAENAVRGKFPFAMRISSAGGYDAKVEYVIHPDFGGGVPHFIFRRKMASQLDHVTAIRGHFQQLRELREWNAEDGAAVGLVLTTKSKADKGGTRVEARVRELMGKQKGLKELGEKHDWFEVLLTKIAENKLRPAGDSKAKLCNMSAKEANVIGGALASSIAANLTAPAAVDEWIGRYPALKELDLEYVRDRSKRENELAAAARQRPTPTTARAYRAGRAAERANKLHLLCSQAPSLMLALLVPPPLPHFAVSRSPI
jgi:hypothetical protein